MESGRERIAFIVLAGVGVLLAVFGGIVAATLAPVSMLLDIIALILAVLAFAVKDYAYLIDPIMHMKGRTLVLDTNDPFYVASNGKAIIVRPGKEVYATSYIKIPVYKSSTEMSDEEKFNFSTVFSRAISISNAPIRMSSQLHIINKDEYVRVVTEKLNIVEDRYNTVTSNKEASKAELDRVKGELNMWHNLLDNISKANSESQIAYVTVTAMGETEDQAVNLATVKAEQVASGLSATLGVPASVVSGDDMMLFIEPESLIPSSAAEDFMKVTR